MHRLIILSLIIIFANNLLAQSSNRLLKVDRSELKYAQENLEYENYVEAYDLYWSLYVEYPDHPDINYGVGVCKLNRRGEEKDALQFLVKATENSKNSDAIFYLGKANHVNNKFEEAISLYEKYKVSKKGTIEIVEVNRAIDKSKNAIKMIANPVNVQVLNLGNKINTPNQESVPVLLPNGNGMFFTSRRKGGFSDRTDFQGKYFQDVYFSTFSKTNGWGYPDPVEEFNSDLHDASVSISNNGATFLFFRTNLNITGGDLYYSTYGKDRLWSKPIKFGDQVNSMYQELSACLFPDENTMIFSSNRPGGYGGFDLYSVKKLPNGKWGLPVNLGPNINTEFNEDSPFIFADGKTLYFSSTGHNGMGGFDVFKSELNDQGIWTTPVNLGYPINTVEQDIYFVLQADGKKAFYSSDRTEGYGGDDIYEIRMLNSDAYQSVVKLSVVDESTKKPIAAKITLVDEKTHKLNGVYRTNTSNGECIMVILAEVNYQLVIEANGYESKIVYKMFFDNELSTIEQIDLKQTGL